MSLYKLKLMKLQHEGTVLHTLQLQVDVNSLRLLSSFPIRQAQTYFFSEKLIVEEDFTYCVISILDLGFNSVRNLASQYLARDFLFTPRTITFRNNSHLFRLSLVLQMYESTDLVSRPLIEQEQAELMFKKELLQLRKMPEVYFKFADKIFPIAIFLQEIIRVFLWKDPVRSAFFLIAGTLLLLFFQISMLTAFLAIIVFRQKILAFVLRSVSNPKQLSMGDTILRLRKNLEFLYTQMQSYNSLYDQICQILYEPDKKVLIEIISKRVLWVLLLLLICLYALPLRISLLIMFWMCMANKLIPVPAFKQNGPQLSVSQYQKEIYFYQFEDWWVGFGWTKSIGNGPFEADQERLIKLNRADFHVQNQGNWKLGDWEIDFSKGTDEEGWEEGFGASWGLAKTRRRRWKRLVKRLG